MSRTFVYTNPNGTSLTISSNDATCLLTSIEGLDIANITLQEQKAPFQDGTTYIDQLLQTREIVVQGIIRKSQNLSGIDTTKRTMIAALNNKLGPGTITYTNAAGTTYYATGLPEGPLFKNKSYTDPRQAFQIVFHCYDPCWYGPTQTVSPTGLTLSYGTLPSLSHVGIAYGKGIFVIISSSSTVISYSTDGILWSSSSISNHNWTSVAYGNGVFVVIATGGTVSAYSYDGIAWHDGTISNHNWATIAYGNGVFIAMNSSDATQVYSYDGINWVDNTISNYGWTFVAYGNGVFVAVTAGGTHTGYSSDGISWSYGTITNHTFNSIAYGNGYFVAISADGTIAYSLNGNTWTYSSIAAHNYTNIIFGNGMFVVASTSDTILGYSSDGISWSYGTIINKAWYRIAYGNGLFVGTDTATASFLLTCFSITSTGDISTPVLITITFPGTNPIISCNDKYIRLVHAFATSDIITINTAFGHKTILKNTSIGATPTNIIQYIDLSSTFWSLTPGVNNITVSNSNSPTTMQVGIIYSEKYIGL